MAHVHTGNGPIFIFQVFQDGCAMLWCFPTVLRISPWVLRFASAAWFDPPCRCKPTWTGLKSRGWWRTRSPLPDWINTLGQIPCWYALTSWWLDFNTTKINSIGPFPPEVAFLIQSSGTFNNQKKLPSCSIFALQVLFLQYFKDVNIGDQIESIMCDTVQKRIDSNSNWKQETNGHHFGLAIGRYRNLAEGGKKISCVKFYESIQGQCMEKRTPSQRSSNETSQNTAFLMVRTNKIWEPWSALWSFILCRAAPYSKCGSIARPRPQSRCPLPGQCWHQASSWRGICHVNWIPSINISWYLITSYRSIFLLSNVACCTHPPKKKNATWIPWMQEMEPNEILKQVGKSLPTCEVWAAQGPTPLATAPAPTMQQWGSGGQAAKHIALEIQQNTRQESPPKVPCPSSFSALVDWTSVATSRPMQIKYALGI